MMTAIQHIVLVAAILVLVTAVTVESGYICYEDYMCKYPFARVSNNNYSSVLVYYNLVIIVSYSFCINTKLLLHINSINSHQMS